MARSLRGWIRNLGDGQGPPPGSVDVAARVLDDDGTLDLLNAATHGTGPLRYVHDASGSQDLADGGGHFGWDMEFSPGQITQTIVPHDPQTEYRARFPDESAQVGKAYHSDLERLAWTGGRDGLVWNGIAGGHDPLVAAWSWDPLLSGLQGNWSVAAFSPALGFSLRRGVGFVGGTVFSIEHGDLAYPIPGDDPTPPNNNAQDRWDLVCLNVVTDPAAYNYGKQRLEVLPGVPGGGVPKHPGQPTTPLGRRLVLHALKVPANGSVYNQVLDLRRWLWHPSPPRPSLLAYLPTPDQVLVPDGTTVASVLNTTLQNQPMTLPLGSSWRGQATYSVAVETNDLSPGNPIERADFGVITAIDPYLVSGAAGGSEGFNPGGALPQIHFMRNSGHYQGQGFTATIPLPAVNSYHVDSNVSPTSRVWPTARAQVFLFSNRLGVVNLRFINQKLSVEYWPVA